MNTANNLTKIINANIDPYERLRIAILAQAVIDFEAVISTGKESRSRGPYCNIDSLQRFFRSSWCKQLTRGTDIKAAMESRGLEA